MTNGTMIQFFHWYTPGGGKLWKEIKEKAEYLSSLGITAAWLPPPYKSANGGLSPGYDVYDLFDLGEFDQKGTIPTKYGTKEELIAAVDALHAHGIGVIGDVVLNHKGGGDETEKVLAVKMDPENRLQPISEPHEIEHIQNLHSPEEELNIQHLFGIINVSAVLIMITAQGKQRYLISSRYGGMTGKK